MARFDLTDEEYALLLAYLPPQANAGRRGHPFRDHRTILNGIRWVLRTGSLWRDLPEQYCPWQTCYDRFARWQKDGA